MQFEIKIEGLERLADGMRQSPRTVFKELSGAIKTSVNLIRPIMRTQTPKGQTRRLSRNIYAKFDGLEGRVGPDLEVTPYALYVHEGTRAHEIRPKLKKALYWKGAKYPVAKVSHPGTKANPFVKRTFDQIKSPVESIFQKALDRIISSIAK